MQTMRTIVAPDGSVYVPLLVKSVMVGAPALDALSVLPLIVKLAPSVISANAPADGFAEPRSRDAAVGAVSFAKVTAPSSILAVVTASAAMVGFGYVPVRSPPAAPFGARELESRESSARTGFVLLLVPLAA
jgi:hypothetical protein